MGDATPFSTLLRDDDSLLRSTFFKVISHHHPNLAKKVDVIYALSQLIAREAESRAQHAHAHVLSNLRSTCCCSRLSLCMDRVGFSSCSGNGLHKLSGHHPCPKHACRRGQAAMRTPILSCEWHTHHHARMHCLAWCPELMAARKQPARQPASS
eukprot:scaffold29288_cov19-Tisochrysis_lutea.AAC.1